MEKRADERTQVLKIGRQDGELKRKKGKEVQDGESTEEGHYGEKKAGDRKKIERQDGGRKKIRKEEEGRMRTDEERNQYS